jgi:hypothetical protein
MATKVVVSGSEAVFPHLRLWVFPTVTLPFRFRRRTQSTN